ncbi:hypothetical protein [Runella limosa]|uniref:hypothetical protein n=1 Tax=Runella limosa TaxID=370978 RepID=UPI000425DB03|nr:hypothetical protein [Runella limosa]
MKKLAIIQTDENDAFVGVVSTYFETEPEAFEAYWENIQKSVQDWADFTRKINYGVISYLHSIGALWIDENNQFQTDFKNFTLSSVIDGLLANERYLPEEITTHMGYIIVQKSVKTLKKLFPKGRELPIDIGVGLKYLGPLLPTYVAYSRRDPEMSRILDTLLPELESFLQPLINDNNVSSAN